MLAKLKTRENIWIRNSSGIWWTFSCLIQDIFLRERGGDCLYNILITYKFVITSYILHHIMSLLVIFFIHLINCSSFICPTKSPSLIFEQIFSGWFTCPIANGACQACQNILRPIPIYSSTPPHNVIVSLCWLSGRWNKFKLYLVKTLLNYCLISSLENH